VSHTGDPIFFLFGKRWTMFVPVGTLAACEMRAAMKVGVHQTVGTMA